MAYRFLQRPDKGFDFYKDNKKIYIDEYVKGTGANENNLRTMMAQRNDPVSQNILKQNKLPVQFKAPATNPLSIGSVKTPNILGVKQATPSNLSMGAVTTPTIKTAPKTIQSSIFINFSPPIHFINLINYAANCCLPDKILINLTIPNPITA